MYIYKLNMSMNEQWMDKAKMKESTHRRIHLHIKIIDGLVV